MTRKLFLTAALALIALVSRAQTNIQLFYDFGTDRQLITTTLEGFYSDPWGSTFFFIDYDFRLKEGAPDGTYMEIARCLNFWQNSPLGGLSLHVEYNGGRYSKYGINHAALAGLDYFFHSSDFRNTLNIQVQYKWISYAGQGFDPQPDYVFRSKVPLQFTAVWGMQDLFGIKGLRFNGFADFWWQDHVLFTDHKGDLDTPQLSHIVFISEPQLWYNVGQWFGVKHLNIGGEVELSYDFGSAKGFWARPCLGLKWVF